MGVKNDTLLDEETVRHYLAETVPVDYGFEFKDEVIRPSVKGNKLLDQRLRELQTFAISVNEVPVFKFYQPMVEIQTGDGAQKVGRMNHFVIEQGGVEYAWGWYALNERVSQMNNTPFKSLRMRKLNMAVGNFDVLTQYFPKAIDNTYVIGELFLTHPNIKPSGSRDDITDSPEAQVLKILLRDRFSQIHKIYDGISRLNSQHLKAIAETEIDIRKLSSQKKAETDKEETKKLQQEIDRKRNLLDHKYAALHKHLKQKCSTEEAITLSKDMIEAVSEWAAESIEEFNTSTEVIKRDGQIKLNLADEVYRRVNTHEDKPQGGRDSLSENHGEPTSMGGDAKSSKAPKVPTELDAYSALSKVERDLMKKVYAVVNKVPELSTSVLDKIKSKLVKKITG